MPEYYERTDKPLEGGEPLTEEQIKALLKSLEMALNGEVVTRLTITIKPNSDKK